MANIFLKPTAQFKPFSYQEMLAPIKAYQDAYDALDKELGILEDAVSSQAFVFQGSNYESQYKDYLKSLNDITSTMSNGNLSDVKKQIKAARSTFLNTLAPAAQRITKLNTLRDKQNAEQAANPFIRFSTDYRNVDDSDITASSNYTSYDLSKIYDQIAKDTLSRIASDYRPQVGDPTKIEGTNSYIVKHGYGMTQEEYNDALNTPDSDLNKFIASEVKKATNGITNQDVIDEVTRGVQNTIKSNIGKFEQTTVKGDNNSTSDLIRELEFNYKYTKDPVTGQLRYSDQYQKDRGWIKNPDDSWSKPNNDNQNNQAKYQAGPQNPIVINADEITKVLNIQKPLLRRFKEVEKSGEFDYIKGKAQITETRNNKEYSGKKFNPLTELKEDSEIKKLILDTVGAHNVNNYMYLYDANNGHVYILPQKQHKVNNNNSEYQEKLPESEDYPSSNSTEETGD